MNYQLIREIVLGSLISFPILAVESVNVLGREKVKAIDGGAVGTSLELLVEFLDLPFEILDLGIERDVDFYDILLLLFEDFVFLLVLDQYEVKVFYFLVELLSLVVKWDYVPVFYDDVGDLIVLYSLLFKIMNYLFPLLDRLLLFENPILQVLDQFFFLLFRRLVHLFKDEIFPLSLIPLFDELVNS